MTNTNAVRQLRRLLDERGIEYRNTSNTSLDNGQVIWRNADGMEFRASNACMMVPEEEYAKKLIVHMVKVTPEQAIAATLGSDKPPYDELLRCLENDWHIHASWDGLRKFWNIELTEEGVRMRDARAERVRTCHLEETVHQREIASEFGGGYYEETTHDCDECGFENADCNIRFCGGCGAKVVSADD